MLIRGYIIIDALIIDAVNFACGPPPCAKANEAAAVVVVIAIAAIIYHHSC
jgi:hypothetical protein